MALDSIAITQASRTCSNPADGHCTAATAKTCRAATTQSHPTAITPLPKSDKEGSQPQSQPNLN